MNESLSPRVARSRAKILAAATDLLVESGARSVTVDAVEAASGVAKSTLYRHFSSRDDLLVAVVRSSLPDITEPDLSVGFEQALRGLVDSAARAFADPNWARIFPAVVSLRTSMPDLDEFIQADKADRQEALARVLDLGVSDGSLPGPIDIQVATNLLVGPLVFAAITGRGDSSDADALAELARFVVDRFVGSYRN
ncbi:MAG: TetR/AcrR family transcriptional regulator [Ilumatobacter sp.]|uniref:TetR/AcrR family transcriptional regulator n=1 Tax=Ilumatobacter sp. TaxID=1967498 RepID=UPI003C76BE4D